MESDPPGVNNLYNMLYDHRLRIFWQNDEKDEPLEIDKTRIPINISEDNIDKYIDFPSDPIEVTAYKGREHTERDIYNLTWEYSFIPDKLLLKIKRFDSVFGMKDFLVIVGIEYDSEEAEWPDSIMEEYMDLDWWDDIKFVSCK